MNNPCAISVISATITFLIISPIKKTPEGALVLRLSTGENAPKPLRDTPFGRARYAS